MGMAAILVMLPRPFENLFISVYEIGPVVSEDMSFEMVDGRRSLPVL